MRRIWTTAAALLLASTAACSFLDSPKAVADPNNPTVASRDQLFVGVQANTFAYYEGYVPMLVCMWMQQCAGVNSRFVQTEGEYGITHGSLDFTLSGVYVGGGLIGIRAVEASADAAGDKLYKGIAEVHEAMVMMLTADAWGDIPYRQAITATSQAPFDPQLQIYDDLLALLDKAIADLNGGGAGPSTVDLVYTGNKTQWTEAAHTLKARIYLHRVEKLGNGEYAKALAEAKLGISKPANDWLTQHSANNAERNVWQQFQTTSGFGQDLVAGARLVEIMKAQNDPRLPEYYAQAPGGSYVGFDATHGTPADLTTVSLLRGTRETDPTFRQPIITYDENQLIIAEASLQTGDPAGAATALNLVRARYGKTPIAAPTLSDIMTEKYIALFQNPEYWNDYKRTCLPTLTPVVGKAIIPGRFLYGQTLVQTDPQPATANDDISTRRNANDPNACQ
jgi:starch-binding outer membrane protein, SusD/RagB family